MKFAIVKTTHRIYFLSILMAFRILFLPELLSQTNEVLIENPFINELYSFSNSDSLVFIIRETIAYGEENAILDNTIKHIIEKATSLKNTGYYFQASEILLETLKQLDGEHNKVNRAWCELALSEFSRAALLYDAGIAFAKSSMIVFKEMDIAKGSAMCYNRLSAIYYEQKETSKAWAMCDSSQIIAKQLNDQSLLISNYELLGAIHRKNGDSEKAFIEFRKAIEICDYLNDTIAKTNLLFNIMLTYRLIGDTDSVLFYGAEAYKYATLTGVTSQKFYAANYLATSYAKRKEWEEAYKYNQIAKILRIKLFKQTEQTQIKRLYAEYESEQQKLKIKEQAEMLSKERHRRKLFIIVVIGLVIIVLLMFNFYILKYRSEIKISKQNKLLLFQKEQIKMETIEFKEQNKKLVELGQFKDSMMNMVVHDLKNPLSAMISLSQFSDSKDILPVLSQSARQMLNLVSNILDINRYENAKLEPVLSLEKLSGICKEVTDEFEYFLSEKEIHLECNIPNNTMANIDKGLIKRVLVNLVDNAIKYSPNKGKITINLDNEQKAAVAVHILNEGPSIPSKHHQTIFKKYVQVGQFDKVAGKSTGLGLTFCKLAVEAHGGSIGVNSSGEVGVDFWFSIPVS